MHVAVASTFRDAVGYIDRYVNQAHALLTALEARGDTVQFIWGENDSIDDTSLRLRNILGPITVVNVSTGAPYYRSHEDHEKRWANVATFCNATLELVPACDVLAWVESDLVWDVDTAVSLIDRARWTGGVYSAPVWMGEKFYDTWSTRRNGEPFGPDHGDWQGVVKVDSCAGLLAVPGELTHHRYEESDAVRAWCRAMGGVWLDTDLRVGHP